MKLDLFYSQWDEFRIIAQGVAFIRYRESNELLHVTPFQHMKKNAKSSD